MPLKQQSATEYLMTYGWAIVVIAIVLGILYEFGVFGNQTIVNDCVPTPGFLCQQFYFSANTANPCVCASVNANLGVISTQTWTNVYFVVVPEGQTITDTVDGSPDYNNANDLFYWGKTVGQYNSVSTLYQGQVIPVTIYINTQNPLLIRQSLGIGTKLTGTIWAMYSTATTTNAVTEVAVFSGVSEVP